MSLSDYLKQNKKTHLIFDFDYTLFKLSLPWDDYLKELGVVLKKTDAKIMDDFFAEKTSFSELQNKFTKLYGTKLKNLIISKSIKFETGCLEKVEKNEELLSFVKKNRKYVLYVWSSNTTDVILPILKRNKMANLFAKIVSRQSVDFIKPDPEGFYKLYDSNIPKEKYLMIGDSSHDERAAKKAGIDFFKSTYFKSWW